MDMSDVGEFMRAYEARAAGEVGPDESLMSRDMVAREMTRHVAQRMQQAEVTDLLQLPVVAVAEELRTFSVRTVGGEPVQLIVGVDMLATKVAEADCDDDESGQRATAVDGLMKRHRDATGGRMVVILSDASDIVIDHLQMLSMIASAVRTAVPPGTIKPDRRVHVMTCGMTRGVAVCVAGMWRAGPGVYIASDDGAQITGAFDDAYTMYSNESLEEGLARLSPHERTRADSNLASARKVAGAAHDVVLVVYGGSDAAMTADTVSQHAASAHGSGAQGAVVFVGALASRRK